MLRKAKAKLSVVKQSDGKAWHSIAMAMQSIAKALYGTDQPSKGKATWSTAKAR